MALNKFNKDTKSLIMNRDQEVLIQEDFIPEKYYQDDVELKEVIIPDGITTIRGEAFVGCSNLTSVTLPASLKRIERNAFFDCTSLVTINIPSDIDVIDCILDSKGFSKMTLKKPFDKQKIIKFLVEGYSMEFNPDNYWD